jgi:beta-lactamase superfamily II metal-dependent hydrolase
MKLHVLAAGQADTMVLELPSGRLAVIDFGHDCLLSYLDHLDPERTKRYAFCLLTHAHHDHYACLQEFVRRHDDRVEEYWLSFVDTCDLAPLVALRDAASRRVRGRRRGRLLVQDSAARSFELEPNVHVTQFAPDTYEVTRAPGDGGSTAENNRSVVLLLCLGAAVAILGADAEEQRWLRIDDQTTEAGLSLQAGLVKAPHHGAASPRGLPNHLWSTLQRSPETFVVFSVGRRSGKPDLHTIGTVRGKSQIRCTGRSLICRPSHSFALPVPQVRDEDLVSLALAPAPEARAIPTCFGTQVYDFDPTHGVTMLQSEQPAFLDACL